jgi:hypothetical protein
MKSSPCLCELSDADAYSRAAQTLREPAATFGEIHPAWELVHARSVKFFARHDLGHCKGERGIIEARHIARGAALAFPYVSTATLQVVVDWIAHNCLHDDAVERMSDIYEIADLGRWCRRALAGEVLPAEAPPLAQVLSSWRREAAQVAPASWLEQMALRSDAMSQSFVAERLLADTGPELTMPQYVDWRVQAGPFDVFFSFVQLAVVPVRATVPAQAVPLRRLAVKLAVLGNDLRSAPRERHEASLPLLRKGTDTASDSEALVQMYNEALEQFEDLAPTLSGDAALYAEALGRAVNANAHWERSSSWATEWVNPEPAPPLLDLVTC